MLPLNDGLGVDLLAHKLLSLAQELSGEHADRGGAVTDLLILNLGEVHEDLGGRVVKVDGLEDRGTVVGNDQVTLRALGVASRHEDLVLFSPTKKKEKNRKKRTEKSFSTEIPLRISLRMTKK